MTRQANPGAWTIVRRKKGDRAKYDGWYVLWTKPNGARVHTYAGRNRATAQALLKKKQAERRAADLQPIVIAATVVSSS